MSAPANGTMLRVGLDYRAALLGAAGIPRVSRELARALAARDDIDLRLYGHCLRRCGVPTELRPPTLRRAPIPSRALPLLGRLGIGADDLVGRPAVFHSIDFAYLPLRHARSVVTVHDVSFATHPQWHGAAQATDLDRRCRQALATAQLVLTPTAASRDALRATALAPAQTPIRVVPFGSDHAPPAAAPGDRSPHPRDYILAVGTIEPRKNHARLLAAWRRLDAPRPDLVVIGKPGWESAAVLRALSANEPGLLWIPDADDARLGRYLAHARIVAYPSLLEGFGFPPLEALAAGVTVVAGDTPALREVCGDAARYCDPTSTDAIRDALAAALGEPEEVRQRGRAQGIARAREFSWARCAADHLACYREAAAP